MSKHIALSFGRAAGITKGHQKVFEQTIAIAEQVGGSAHIHLSKSFDSKKNPLSHDDKIELVGKMMPHVAPYLESVDSVKTLFHVLAEHSDPEATLHLVAGGDRLLEYQTKFDKYNGQDFNYKDLVMHSSGDRDDGVSGTHLRNLALADNFEEFKEHAPTTSSDTYIREMFDKIRSNMLTEGVKKTLDSLLLEASPYKGDITEIPEKSTKASKRLLSIKNKIIINPDFSTYQAKTHKDSKDPDTSLPLDNINTNGSRTTSSTSTFATGSNS